jgi:hypothetical protein
MTHGTGPRSHPVSRERVTVPASAGHPLQFSSGEIESNGGNAASCFEIGSSGAVPTYLPKRRQEKQTIFDDDISEEPRIFAISDQGMNGFVTYQGIE